MIMKLRSLTSIATFTVALIVAFAALNSSSRLGFGAVSVGRNGDLHIIKDCAQYFAAGGAAGSFCTITSSNFPEIPNGSRIYYDQTIGTPAGFLDSNVLLNTGTPGNWAIGRCTLDASTGLGLCTFSDGSGPLAGFRARIDVSPTGTGDCPSGVCFHWDGTYKFTSVDKRDDK